MFLNLRSSSTTTARGFCIAVRRMDTWTMAQSFLTWSSSPWSSSMAVSNHPKEFSLGSHAKPFGFELDGFEVYSLLWLKHCIVDDFPARRGSVHGRAEEGYPGRPFRINQGIVSAHRRGWRGCCNVVAWQQLVIPEPFQDSRFFLNHFDLTQVLGFGRKCWLLAQPGDEAASRLHHRGLVQTFDKTMKHTKHVLQEFLKRGWSVQWAAVCGKMVGIHAWLSFFKQFLKHFPSSSSKFSGVPWKGVHGGDEAGLWPSTYSWGRSWFFKFNFLCLWNFDRPLTSCRATRFWEGPMPRGTQWASFRSTSGCFVRINFLKRMRIDLRRWATVWCRPAPI